MKTNKTFILAALISMGASPVGLYASPLVSIGDNVDVYFDGSASTKWQSNLFRDSSDEIDDLVFTLSPGFKVNFGRGESLALFSVTTRYDIRRYVDNSSQDNERLTFGVNGGYSSSRLSLSGSASYFEDEATNGDVNVVGDLIETDNYRVTLNGEYRLSPKFSFSSGVTYTLRDYTSFEQIFGDRDTISIPFDVYYELTPKLDLSVGYRYNITSLDDTAADGGGNFIGGYDNVSHFFNVGARGTLLPKLSGSIRVGYTERDSDDSVNFFGGTNFVVPRSDSSATIGVDTALSYFATEKVTATLNLNRDFGVTGSGDVSTNTRVRLGGKYKISSFVSAQAGFGYTRREHEDGSGREDDQYDFSVSGSYRPNQYWSLALGYTLQENISNVSAAEYNNNIISLSATLRY